MDGACEPHPVSARMKTTGFRDLNRMLERLAAGISEDTIRQALHDGGEVIAAEARRLAPVDTGTLRDSIQVTDERDASLYGRPNAGDGISVYVGPVGSTEDGDVFYAKFIEFGTTRHGPQPFLRPAIEGKAQEAGEIIVKALDAALRKAVR